VPTGAALFFLRPYRRFWAALSTLGLAVAITGVAAVVLFAVGRHLEGPSALATLGGLSVLRILVAPLFGLGFLVCTFVAPHRSPRLALLVATAMEAAVTAYAGVGVVSFLSSRTRTLTSGTAGDLGGDARETRYAVRSRSPNRPVGRNTSSTMSSTKP
jgi:hypothetical protein